jgi:hypothetical protein
MAKSQKSVVLNIRKVNLDSPEAALTVKLSGARNALPSEYSKAVNGFKLGAGKVVLASKGSTKLSAADAANVKLTTATSYTKVKLIAKGLALARGADSIELDVTDGVPMAAVSIGQSKIGIGRSRKKGQFKKYTWAQLHLILGYGEQVFRELNRQKSESVQLLVVSAKNACVELANSPEQMSKDARSVRGHRMMVLTGKERLIDVRRV